MTNQTEPTFADTLANAPESPQSDETRWLAPSPLGCEFSRYSDAMAPCREIPVGKSFALGADFDEVILKEFAAEFKDKKIVVINHGEGGFEIRRLNDNDSVRLFYKMLKKNVIGRDDDLTFEMILDSFDDFYVIENKNAIESYKVFASDEAIKNKVFSYSLFHKRFFRSRSAKNYPEGETQFIKDCLTYLVKTGKLRHVVSNERDYFGTKAELYQIVK